MSRTPRERCPTHPGRVLRTTVLPAKGWSISEAARRLGVSRQRLHGIVHEHQPVREDMALRLERLFGSSAEMWLGMQSAHDLWHHRRRMAAELADIHPQPDNHAAG